MKRFFLVILLTLQTIPAGAQTDTEQRQSNLLSDFNTVDIVAFLQVAQCTIVDTIGSYTVQQVDATIIRCYKGCAPEKKITYYGFVETYRQWLHPGGVQGVFLIGGAKNGRLTYGWLENSGFSEEDTAFIHQLTDTDTLYDKLAANLETYEEKPLWVKARLQSISAYVTDERRTATIAIIKSINAPGLTPGKSYRISINNPVYESLHFRSKLRAGATYYFPLYRDGQKHYFSHTESILPRLSPSMIHRLQHRQRLGVTNN